MSNLSPHALALYQAHGPGPVDWERMVRVVDRVRITGRIWRHIKRGTVYTEVCRAELQAAADNPPEEGELMVVYRGEDGNVWVRGAGEFEDGRFEEITPPADREKTEGEAGA